MLYIMRHGKTDWNVRHKLQGRTDIPLNLEGKELAEHAAKECSNIHFDVCYCSPLCRAKETAEIVLKGRNIPIIIDERLKEMGFGVFEGRENNFDEPGNPISVLFKNPESYCAVENGESLEALFARTGEFIHEVIEPAVQQGKDILIMGHGAMNSSIICQIKNIPVEQFWSAGIENCKLMKLK